MVREGACADRSGCFDFAPKGAPLGMTAEAVIPSGAQRNRGIPTVEILAGCASRMEYVFSMPAHNGWG